MPRIEDLQRDVQEIQRSVALPDELQRLLVGLQSQLQTIRKTQSPRRARIVQIEPTPPDIPLTGNQLSIFTSTIQFHAALCQYAGEINRDQWLHLLDVAADMVAAYAGTGGGYILEAPIGPQQPWARNGALESWVLAQPQYGVTIGTPALPGQIGEVMEALTPGWPTSTVPIIVGNIPAQVVNITLTPGDWDVTGYVTWNPAGMTDWLYAFGALSYTQTGPAILDATAMPLWPAFVAAIPIVTHGINVSVNTTVYVIAQLSSTGADSGKQGQAWGYIHARRMR